MRKKIVGIAALSAVMALSASVNAFAFWYQDTGGWRWVYNDGTYVQAGWVTDPDTNLVYYFDPDGYMMTETRVDGYWLDASGVRQDKTEAELQREEEEKKEIQSRPNPAKEELAIKESAKNAKNAPAAVKTTRRHYQAEMNTYMNLALQGAWKDLSLDEENASLKKEVIETTLETTYSINQSDNSRILSASLWLMNNPKNVDYKPESFSMSYNRSLLRTDSQRERLDKAFRTLLINSLGETEGAAIYTELFAQFDAGVEQYEHSASTDSGNSYYLNYRNSTTTISVTCSEIDPEAEAAAAAAAETAAAVEETAASETTSSVITIGQPAESQEAADETEAVAESEASDETEAADETEAVAESEASDETEAADETEAVAESEAADETEAAAESEASAESEAADTSEPSESSEAA